MHDWRRSRIGSNRPGATRQDAQNGGPRYGAGPAAARPQREASSPSCVRTLPIGDRVAKPLPLTLAEFLVSAALVGSVVLAPAWVPVATSAFALPGSAGGSARPKVQLTREGC